MPARKKPVEQHRLDGTFRNDRHGHLGGGGGEQPRHRPPPKPADLEPDAAAHWDFLAPLLADTLTERDGLVFRDLCDLWARQRALRAALAGIPVTDPHALRLVRMIAAGTDRLLKLSERFGLTPLDRQNLRPADAGPPRARVRSRPQFTLDREGWGRPADLPPPAR